MSYRKSHIKSKIHSIKPKKHFFTKLWFWIVVLILIFTATVIYFSFFYSGLWVENIIISGNNKVSFQDLKNVISKNINKNFLGLFSSKSIFFVDNNSLNREILSDFPEIAKSSILKKFPQTLLINIQERQPIGAYCGGSHDCFLIDGTGVVFENLQSVPQNTLIVRQSSEPGEIFTGEDVVNQNIISAISQIQTDLKNNFNIDLNEALIATPVMLDITTNENWHVYFGTDQDSNIKLQITELNLLLNGDITQQVRKTLQYIDLTTKNRAYYK